MFAAHTNQFRPGCHDLDSCGFFFDGLVIELIYTTDRGISPYDEWINAGTIALSEEDQEQMLDGLTEWGYIPTYGADFGDLLDDFVDDASDKLFY